MEIIETTSPMPLPEIAVTVRAATMDDLAFIDSLQKMHSKMVGWMPTGTLAGKIKAGHVLVAEELVVSCQLSVVSKCEEGESGIPSSLTTNNLQPTTHSVPVGYCIAHDQYFKRDDLGIIYQMNVVPGKQRAFVGATLLKAQFEKSAWGCKLYCCWCAQDIAANKFWEAMGFVPLAFRAGSEKKGRVHIFWQKRIRAGDASTPWWFPAETKGGAMMEDRLVFPIPPGTHWSDAKPIVLPRDTHEQVKQIEGAAAPARKKSKPVVVRKVPVRAPLCGGMYFAAPEVVAAAKEVAQKPVREKKQKIRNDPKYVSAARELRDRWLEKMNAGELALPGGKYDVVRTISRGEELRQIAA